MIAHNLNAYKDGYKWITFCQLCKLEAGELIGVHCTGKVEPVICRLDFKNGVDKSDIDAYVARMIAAS